jgi:DNA recombination protein RmuC
MSITILAAIVAFLAGGGIAAAVFSSRAANAAVQAAGQTALQAESDAAHNAATAAQQQLAERAAELRAASDARQLAEREQSRLAEQVKQQEMAFAAQSRDREAAFAARLQLLEQQWTEKVALLTGVRDDLRNQFKAVASEILEEKSKRFTQQNQENLSQLLTPLSENIRDFRQKVEEVYVKESEGRSELGGLVKALMSTTQQVSEGAERLTRALTTQSKAQGNFGEMILAKILEQSGLREGEEYVVQGSYRDVEGNLLRPDVVLRLPEKKQLIIDSKVSLTAHIEYVNAENEELRRAALARHLASVRAHIDELAAKNYQALPELQSIDFVCMFIPDEGAFATAITSDRDLFEYSYRRNVLLMSPSTMLFVVRTVNHLWRQELQRENIRKIVDRGAALYDKLVGFVEELKTVGTRLDQARRSYDDAFGKLHTGHGSVIRQAQMLVELGVKSKKQLPAELVDAADESLLAEKADAAGAE